MSFFAPFENSNALLSQGGVYKTAPISIFEDRLYAKTGTNSYIRLMKHGATSVSKTMWKEIDIDPVAGVLSFDTWHATLIPAKTARARRIKAV